MYDFIAGTYIATRARRPGPTPEGRTALPHRGRKLPRPFQLPRSSLPSTHPPHTRPCTHNRYARILQSRPPIFLLPSDQPITTVHPPPHLHSWLAEPLCRPPPSPPPPLPPPFRPPPLRPSLPLYFGRRGALPVPRHQGAEPRGMHVSPGAGEGEAAQDARRMREWVGEEGGLHLSEEKGGGEGVAAQMARGAREAGGCVWGGVKGVGCAEEGEAAERAMRVWKGAVLVGERSGTRAHPSASHAYAQWNRPAFGNRHKGAHGLPLQGGEGSTWLWSTARGLHPLPTVSPLPSSCSSGRVLCPQQGAHSKGGMKPCFSRYSYPPIPLVSG
jgi:hypothetical protein